jgi:outer membrane protein TolC
MQNSIKYNFQKSGKKWIKKYFHLFLLFSVNILFTSPVFSQSDSLLKYMEIAAGSNPLVLQRFAQYKASLQKIPQASSLSDPQLDIGIYLSPMELVSGNQVADIKLMQMFPWFGVLRNAKDEMSQMANANFEQFRDAKLQVYYDVQRTWYDLYKIRKDISISEKNLEIIRVIEKLALIRYKTAPAGSASSSSQSSSFPSGSSQNQNAGGSSGMQGMNQGGQNSTQSQSPSQMPSGNMGSSSTSGLSDLYRIQIESGDLQNSIAILRDQEITATARFNNYLNRNNKSPVFTDDSIMVDTLTLDQETISDSITANNPMLKMIDFEKKSYAARKKMVTGMGYPMVGLGINYSVMNPAEGGMTPSEMNGKDMIMPMISMTLPIYRKKYNSMKKEADLLGEAASYNYEATANNLQNEYYEAIQLYEDATRRLKLYRSQYVLASRSLEITLKSFSSSSSELTDVLRIRQQTLDYELKQVEALTDLNTSVAWLKRLMSSTPNK